MRKTKFEEHLFSLYPDLYEDVPGGVYVPEGWKLLIGKLSSDICMVSPKIRCRQVKEKFGTLRFYCDIEPVESSVVVKIVEDLIRQAETESSTICEECGNPGSLRKGNWYRTLCEEHYESSRKNT